MALAKWHDSSHAFAVVAGIAWSTRTPACTTADRPATKSATMGPEYLDTSSLDDGQPWATASRPAPRASTKIFKLCFRTSSESATRTPLKTATSNNIICANPKPKKSMAATARKAGRERAPTTVASSASSPSSAVSQVALGRKGYRQRKDRKELQAETQQLAARVLPTVAWNSLSCKAQTSLRVTDPPSVMAHTMLLKENLGL
mmetsp:Transcript_119808/g.284665  ORF Transcript_119808/g.284665 Transcript_119808/m.284665 type:complete len:203 (-) Transcript_119808:216-824(-)